MALLTRVHGGALRMHAQYIWSSLRSVALFGGAVVAAGGFCWPAPSPLMVFVVVLHFFHRLSEWHPLLHHEAATWSLQVSCH